MIRPGQLLLYKAEDHWVLNFPTKDDFFNPSDFAYIELGLLKFRNFYKEKGFTSIAFPRLGCGLGGLDWEMEVKPVMEELLGDLDIDVYIYE